MNNELPATEALIDRWLSQPDVFSRHSKTIRSSAAVMHYCFLNHPLPAGRISRWLMIIRRWPLFLKGRPRAPSLIAKPLSMVENLQKLGLIVLEQDHQEVVLGFAGKFWSLAPQFLSLTKQEYRDFSGNGYAKAAVSFRFKPLDALSCVVSTETRVLASDPRARFQLKLYWSIIEPFSGLIRRQMLTALANAPCCGGGGSGQTLSEPNL